MSRLRPYNIFVFVIPAAALQTKTHPNVKDLFDMNLHGCAEKNKNTITICADTDKLQDILFQTVHNTIQARTHETLTFLAPNRAKPHVTTPTYQLKAAHLKKVPKRQTLTEQTNSALTLSHRQTNFTKLILTSRIHAYTRTHRSTKLMTYMSMCTYTCICAYRYMYIHVCESLSDRQTRVGRRPDDATRGNP